MDAIVEPHPQPQAGIAKHGVGNRLHVGQRGVAELNGVEPFGYGQSHRRRGLAAGGAGPVVAPIGDGSGGIDQREAEVSSAIKLGGADRHSALVVDELRHLRLKRGQA